MGRNQYFNWGNDDWQRWERMARKGFDKLSELGAFSERGNLGDTFRVGRMLASGDLRLVILYFVEQQPRHGYDLIKAIEEKTSGFYSPSPGIVYPALTYLEEAGYVTAREEGNKKLYTITDEGRAHLADNRESVQSTLDHLSRVSKRWSDIRDNVTGFGEKLRRDEHRHGHHGDRDRDIPEVLPEVNEARRELKAAIAEASRGDNDKQRRLAEILRRAAEDVRNIPDRIEDEPDIDL